MLNMGLIAIELGAAKAPKGRRAGEDAAWAMEFTLLVRAAEEEFSADGRG